MPYGKKAIYICKIPLILIFVILFSREKLSRTPSITFYIHIDFFDPHYHHAIIPKPNNLLKREKISVHKT